MRKYLPALLTLSLLAAPGCMLAIGNGPDDESAGGTSRIGKLEKRVTDLEHKLQECSAACCSDDGKKDAEAHEHAEHAEHGAGK